jgi:RHH-type transcriptional regulator, rel operon repressor / antitoxin RelB
MIAVRLPSEIENRLARLSRLTGRTKTHYVREAILAYMDDLEDYFLAEERMRTFDRAKTISLDDLVKKYGVED